MSDKILKDRALKLLRNSYERQSHEIVRHHKCDGYQRALASMAYKFFSKKTGSGVSANEQLAEELHKTVIKKFKRRKVYARFKDNIWTADLAEMG